MTDRPTRYRKKPVVIEAERNDTGESIFIDTLEGRMEALPGDYIITGVKGERYPCKPDIFDATYEEVGEAMTDRPTHDEAMEALARLGSRTNGDGSRIAFSEALKYHDTLRAYIEGLEEEVRIANDAAGYYMGEAAKEHNDHHRTAADLDEAMRLLRGAAWGGAKWSQDFASLRRRAEERGIDPA